MNLVFANLGGNALGLAAVLVSTWLYSPAAVGGGMALIAAASLLGTMASLGLGTGILRFLPEAGVTARQLLVRLTTISALLSVLVGVGFVAGRSIWAENLPLIDTWAGAAVFVASVSANALAMLQDGLLLATRRSGLLSARTWGAGALRIVCLLPLVAAGTWGIFASWFASSGLSTAVAAVRIRVGSSGLHAGPATLPAPPATAQVVRFSLENYAVDLVSTIPASLMPLILIGALGEAPTAYYVVGALAGTVAATIARGATVALFAEGSRDQEQIAALSRRAILFAMALLVPVTAAALVLAEPVLAILGPGYAAEGTWNLRLQVLSALPATLVMVHLVILRIQGRLRTVFAITLLGSVVTVLLASALVESLGVSGGGLAILAGQLLMASVVARALTRQLRRARTAG